MKPSSSMTDSEVPSFAFPRIIESFTTQKAIFSILEGRLALRLFFFFLPVSDSSLQIP